MGIRENLNEHKGATVGATIGIIVLAIIGIMWFSGSGNDKAGGTEKTAFFTSDDGKTFFVEDGSKIPPFDHNGKPAYGCFVFTSDGGKTKTVAWLYRYTEQGKKQMEALRASKGAEIGPSPFQHMEVKKPGTGDQGWMRAGDPRARDIQVPSSPSAEQVFPE